MDVVKIWYCRHSSTPCGSGTSRSRRTAMYWLRSRLCFRLHCSHWSIRTSRIASSRRFAFAEQFPKLTATVLYSTAMYVCILYTTGHDSSTYWGKGEGFLVPRTEFLRRAGRDVLVQSSLLCCVFAIFLSGEKTREFYSSKYSFKLNNYLPKSILQMMGSNCTGAFDRLRSPRNELARISCVYLGLGVSNWWNRKGTRILIGTER